MAAVTVNSQKFTVAGNVRNDFYNIAGASGDTLVVGLTTIKKVNFDPGVITAAVVTPGANGTSSIAFTGGPFTNTNIEVFGY